MVLDDLFDINDNGKYDIVDQVAMEDSTSDDSDSLDDDGFQGSDESCQVEGVATLGAVCPECGGQLYDVKIKDESYSICGRYPICNYMKKV
jgi:Topoisomerase DNA binding C4 zinc finger.